MVVTGAWAQTYNVSVKEGTEDADKWSSNPNPATAGQTVTITYSGTKKVKSVKAVKKAPSSVLVTAITLNKTATTIYKVNGTATETLSVTAVTPDEAMNISLPNVVNKPVPAGLDAEQTKEFVEKVGVTPLDKFVA